MAIGGGGIQLPTLVQRYRLEARQGIAAAETQIAQFSTRATRRATQTGRVLSRGLTFPIVGAFGVMAATGTRDLITVERGLREVNSLFGETGAAGERNFRQVQQMVKDLSAEVGIAQETLVGGLYQAISAGVPRENAFEFMRVASEASVAGVTDVETAVDGLTSIVNAFGLEAADAQAVADSMFATVQGGKTNFEQLATSIFQAAPAAAAAGVSFQEVNAAIATLTASGTPTAVATTQIRAALVGLNRPSADLNRIFQDLGYRNAQAAIEAEGLGFALSAVADAAGGNQGRLQTLLGSVEAVAAANVIAGTGAEKFQDELERQANSAGAATDAFEEMDQSTSRRLERLRVTFQNLSMELAARLLPLLNRVVEMVVGAVDWFGRLSPTMQRVIGVITGIVAALGPTILVVAKFLNAWRAVKTALDASKTFSAVVSGLRSLGAGFQAFGATLMANPVFLIIGALVALGIALFVLYKKNETFRKFIDAAWQKIQKIFKSALDFVKRVIAGAVEFVRDHWEQILAVVLGPIGLLIVGIIKHFTKIRTIVTTTIRVLIEIFRTGWSVISGVIRTAVNIIRAVLRPLIAILNVTVGNAFRLVLAIVRAWGPKVVAFVTFAVKTIVRIVRTYLGILRTVWSTAWRVISNVLRPILAVIGGAIRTAFGIWRTIFTTYIGTIRNVWNRGWGFIRDYIVPILRTVGNKVRDFAGVLRRAISTAVEAIGNVWRGLKNTFASVVNWVIRNVINRFINAINRVAGALGIDANLSTLNEINVPSAGGRHAGGIIGRGRGTRKGRRGGLRSDEEMIVAQKGEGVVPLDAMRKIGPEGFVNLIRKGAIPEAEGMDEYARAFPGMGFGLSSLNPVNLVSGAIDAVGNGISAVVSAGRRAIAAVARPMVNRALDVLDSIPFGGSFKDYIVGALRRVGDWILDWIAGVETELDNVSPELSPGIGWEAMMAALRVPFPGLELISGLRPGAITATGNPSYHGSGRAVDIPPRMDVFDWIRNNYMAMTKELIFSPAGNRQIHNGSDHYYTGITRDMHFDHVHWALANGGLAKGPAVAYLGETYRARPEHIVPDRILRDSIRSEMAQVLAPLDGRPLIGEQKIYGVLPGDVDRETRRAVEKIAASWSRP